MKIFTVIAGALLLGCTVMAAELPARWDAWFFNKTEQDYLKGLTVPKQAPRQIALSEKVLNLDTIAGKCDTALVRCFVEADKAERIWLGVGCKIFGLKLNGKLVYDFRSYGLGNNIEHVAVDNHIIPLDLAAGRNEIAFELRRTHWKQDYCYGKDRKILWDLAVKIHQNYQPAKAALKHPEMVLRPDKNSLMFMFVTTSAMPAGVDYRRKGDQQWIRQYDTVGDLILRENTPVHRVRIENIENMPEIEYRLVMLEPPAGRDGFKHPLWAERLYKEVYTPVKTIVNPHRKDLRVFFFADTQLSLSESCKTVAQRDALLSRMRALDEYKKAHVIGHLGDQDSFFHEIEKPLLTDLFDKFAPAAGEIVRPWLLVRGNHETNGMAAENWFDYFQMPEDKGFYTAQLGDVFFIVLDCGDISQKNPLNAFNGPLLDLDNLFRKQSAWLEKVRRSPEFRNARYRVVLSHSEPQIQKSIVADNIRKMTEKLLADNSDGGRIHLWLAGHVHRYWRAARGEKKFVSRAALKRAPALAAAPVNWLSIDGPKGNSSNPNFSYTYLQFSDKGIGVKILDETGLKLDEFTVDAKGNLHEIYLDKSLKKYPHPVEDK
jgi:hypothetical protein